MPLRGVTFSNFPALAFFRHHLHNDRAINMFDIFEYIKECCQIMAIKRTKELKAKLFKNGPALAVHHKLFKAGLSTASRFARFITNDR
jgi:hypothetical protein